MRSMIYMARVSKRKRERLKMWMLAAYLMLSTGTIAPAPAADPSNTASPNPEEVNGLWLTQRKDGIFRFESCPQGLCGVLVGLKPNRKPDGKLDSACGVNLFRGMTWNAAKRQWEGRILDPRTGREYGAQVRLPTGASMRLRFFAGISLIGATETWTRYSGTPAADCAMP